MCRRWTWNAKSTHNRVAGMGGNKRSDAVERCGAILETAGSALEEATKLFEKIKRSQPDPYAPSLIPLPFKVRD